MFDVSVLFALSAAVNAALGGALGILVDWGLCRLNVGSARSRALTAILAPASAVLAAGWTMALVVMPSNDDGELAKGLGEGLVALVATLGALGMMVGCVIGLAIRDKVGKSRRNERRLLIGSALILVFIGISGSSSYQRENLMAPAWTDGGKSVTFIRRRSRTLLIGPYPLVSAIGIPSVELDSGNLTLERLEIPTGTVRRLAKLGPGPAPWFRLVEPLGDLGDAMTGRLVPNGNGHLSGQIQVVSQPSAFARKAVFQWSGEPSVSLKWANTAPILDTDGIELLNGDEELMVAGGSGDALVTFVAGKPGRVLLFTPASARSFAKGLTPRVVDENALVSHLWRIRAKFAFGTEEPRLEAQYLRDGLPKDAALLKAQHVLDESGLLPRGPGFVASRISAPPAHVRLFRIPGQRFDVGLYSDIGNAMAHPGQRVEAGTGAYLQYNDDETGPQLEQYLEDGADRFTVERDGKLWLIVIIPGDPLN